MESIKLVIKGHAEPGGSKTAIPLKNKSTGKWLTAQGGRPIVNVVDDNPKVKGWRKSVATQAAWQYTGELLDAPLIVVMTFYLHRWKNHYGTGANARVLKPSAPMYPSGDHPDSLKLARGTEDALSGIVYVDDSRTVDLLARRRYAPGFVLKGMPGEFVEIEIGMQDHKTVGEHAESLQAALAI